MTQPEMPPIPTGWSEYLPIATGLLRTVMAVAGALGAAWAATVSDSQIQMIASAMLVLTAAGWSTWQKVMAIRALRRAAAAPAGDPAPNLPK